MIKETCSYSLFNLQKQFQRIADDFGSTSEDEEVKTTSQTYKQLEKHTDSTLNSIRNLVDSETFNAIKNASMENWVSTLINIFPDSIARTAVEADAKVKELEKKQEDDTTIQASKTCPTRPMSKELRQGVAEFLNESRANCSNCSNTEPLTKGK